MISLFKFFPVFIVANDGFDFAFIQDKCKFIGSIRRIHIDKNQSSFCSSKLKCFQNDADSQEAVSKYHFENPPEFRSIRGDLVTKCLFRFQNKRIIVRMIEIDPEFAPKFDPDCELKS